MKICGVSVLVVAMFVPSLGAQRSNAPQGPPVQVTVNGRTWTQQELFRRNVGGRDDQTAPFPPHKVIGNIWRTSTRGSRRAVRTRSSIQPATRRSWI